MTQHTAEPWKLLDLDLHHVYESGTGWEVVGTNGETVCDNQQYYPHPVSLPDAGRIVACVNACTGINPEAVPELLEALKDMLLGLGPSGYLKGQARRAIALATDKETEVTP